jgi:hypothetical protein
LFVLLAGCGFRITSGSSGDGGAGDAVADGMAGDDGGTTLDDAAIDGMPIDGPLSLTCIPAWIAHTVSFGAPDALSTINDTSYDRDPFVSADELTIWFSNGGGDSQGGGDVFKATRTVRTQPFDQPSRDEDFSTSSGVESKMSMTSDRLFAVFSSNVQGGAGGSDIWETSRATTGSAWGAFSRTHVMALATAASELDAFVTADGLRIYYAPLTPAPQRIMVATRANVTASFGSVAEAGGINTASGEADPMLFANDRVIVFASDRPSLNGGSNIWYATRTGNTGAFGAPVELPGVNTSVDDSDPHVSADGCRIYFSRNVAGGVSWELFSATASSI